MRKARDATLDVPNLVLPSVQVNIRAGHFPPAAADGVSYLKVPLNVIGRPLVTAADHRPPNVPTPAGGP